VAASQQRPARVHHHDARLQEHRIGRGWYEGHSGELARLESAPALLLGPNVWHGNIFQFHHIKRLTDGGRYQRTHCPH
jgi:hypothetical protein